MKKKATVLCLAGALALGTCTVSAANGTKDISATFRNIKIVVDGKTLQTSAEPFIYNGTTYLPIRAVGEAVGKEVTWNGSTNTVYLGEVPADAQQSAAPAADFPVFTKAMLQSGLSNAEAAKMVERIRAGNITAYEVAIGYYGACVAFGLDNHDSQNAKAAYEEAQLAFSFVKNDPEYASAKEYFESSYQNEILPSL